MVNGTSTSTNGTSSGSASTPVGFVAVNARQVSASSGASPATRNDLMSKFFTLSERKTNSYVNGQHEARISLGAPLTTLTPSRSGGSQSYEAHGQPSPLGGLALPATPRSPHAKTSGTTTSSSAADAAKDDPQPHRAAMTAHVETLKKGERIMPPCDRCRRLQMDCVKNLTACQGCTRKHARCAWKDVRRDELRALAAAGGGVDDDGSALRPDRPADLPAPLDRAAAPPVTNGVDAARALDPASAASLAAAAQAVSASDALLLHRLDYAAGAAGAADAQVDGERTPASSGSVARSDSDAERDLRAWGPAAAAGS